MKQHALCSLQEGFCSSLQQLHYVGEYDK